MNRRGSLLLELMLSLAIFVSGGLFILSMLSDAIGSARLAQVRSQAADLVRSAFSQVEAGLASPESLSGPVSDWPPLEGEESGGTGAPGDPQWEMEIETEPSPFDGLTVMRVSAWRLDSRGEPVAGSHVTVSQLVRLTPERREDTVGDLDAMSEAAERGAREERRPERPTRRGPGERP